MGILDFLSPGKAAGEAAGEVVGKTVTAVGNALDSLFTSDDERLTHAEVMERLRQQPGALQVELNKIEAGHASIFVAGWRSYIGWVCGTALAFYFLPQYVMATILWTRACWAADALVPWPLDPAGLLELVFALLGMGTLRTVEKFGGVARDALKKR